MMNPTSTLTTVLCLLPLAAHADVTPVSARLSLLAFAESNTQSDLSEYEDDQIGTLDPMAGGCVAEAGDWISRVECEVAWTGPETGSIYFPIIGWSGSNEFGDWAGQVGDIVEYEFHVDDAAVIAFDFTLALDPQNILPPLGLQGLQIIINGDLRYVVGDAGFGRAQDETGTIEIAVRPGNNEIRIRVPSNITSSGPADLRTSYMTGTIDFTIEEYCQADWNRDGSLNTADLVAYLNDYNAVLNDQEPTYADPSIESPYAILNTADFIAYFNLFNAGCP